MMKISRQFASDNCSGICAEAWAAMAEANVGHDTAYGNDVWTQRAADAIREIFETDCDVFFVFGGTAANSLALAQLCPSYHSILCHELSPSKLRNAAGRNFFPAAAKFARCAARMEKLIWRKSSASRTNRSIFITPNRVC
jgi:threonine aldolase